MANQQAMQGRDTALATETQAGTEVRRGQRGVMAVILGSLTALAPLSIDMYLPALPLLTRDLHASPATVQLSLTFCLLGLAFGQLIAGPVSDARGRRGPLLVGLAVYALASVLCAFTASVWLLIGLRFLQGLAGAAGIVIARAVARDRYAGLELTRFYALLMLVNGAAPVLAPVIGGQVLRFTRWHGVFVVLAALGAAMWLGVAAGLPETLPRERRSASGIRPILSTFGGLLRDGVFLGYVVTQSLVFAAMFAYISGSSFVFQEAYDVTPQAYSLIFAANGMGIVLAGQVTARLAPRFGERKLLTAGVMTAAGGGLTLALTLTLHLPVFAVVPPLFVAIASVGMVSTSSMSLAMQRYGHAAGSASALLGVCQMTMGALVAPLPGLGGADAGPAMGWTVAACDLAAALCIVWLIRMRTAR
nr:multidrug effflux MFS transporter [Alicyclobacillus cellulosilyticus]